MRASVRGVTLRASALLETYLLCHRAEMLPHLESKSLPSLADRGFIRNNFIHTLIGKHGSSRSVDRASFFALQNSFFALQNLPHFGSRKLPQEPPFSRLDNSNDSTGKLGSIVSIIVVLVTIYLFQQVLDSFSEPYVALVLVGPRSSPQQDIILAKTILDDYTNGIAFFRSCEHDHTNTSSICRSTLRQTLVRPFFIHGLSFRFEDLSCEVVNVTMVLLMGPRQSGLASREVVDGCANVVLASVDERTMLVNEACRRYCFITRGVLKGIRLAVLYCFWPGVVTVCVSVEYLSRSRPLLAS
jgi:hypothetical protein